MFLFFFFSGISAQTELWWVSKFSPFSLNQTSRLSRWSWLIITNPVRRAELLLVFADWKVVCVWISGWKNALLAPLELRWTNRTAAIAAEATEQSAVSPWTARICVCGSRNHWPVEDFCYFEHQRWPWFPSTDLLHSWRGWMTCFQGKKKTTHQLLIQSLILLKQLADLFTVPHFSLPIWK